MYASATVNTFADLLAALRAACVTAGWTLTGNVLAKDGCFVETGSAADALSVRGGTGQSSGALTGPGPATCWLRAPRTADVMTFPVTYHLHVLSEPDEVYLVMNWNLVYWQTLAFGKSPVPGLPGSGNWYTASASTNSAVANLAIGLSASTNFLGNGVLCPAPFWGTVNAGNSANSFVHHGLDAGQWSGLNSNDHKGEVASARSQVVPMLSASPNAWNGQACLIPILPTVGRSSNMVSIALNLAHARYLRNDNLADGQIVPIGTANWKTYPLYRKSTALPTGDVSHSGTLGLAVRFDGT